jgi:hypothetical protein
MPQPTVHRNWVAVPKQPDESANEQFVVVDAEPAPKPRHKPAKKAAKKES